VGTTRTQWHDVIKFWRVVDELAAQAPRGALAAQLAAPSVSLKHLEHVEVLVLDTCFLGPLHMVLAIATTLGLLLISPILNFTLLGWAAGALSKPDQR